ncbi:MAG: hypothetical protein A4E65_00128 [Syntrophorhabdus sp. PtaU1.Bin153]|nr:MAG: hypothetical protein A4E65_00128 [Syntrophorhabdus sp. PtaU1.Bin153]
MGRLGKKFHKLMLKDGTEIQVYVDGEGRFRAEYDNVTFSNNIYMAIVNEIIKHYEENMDKRHWEPIIIIKGARDIHDYFDRGRIPEHTRVFRITRPDGKAMYRYFAGEARTNLIRNDDLEGYPGWLWRGSVGVEDIVLPYKPETWLALEMIDEQLRTLIAKIKEILSTEETVVPFLNKIAIGNGLTVLMPAKEEEAEL